MDRIMLVDDEPNVLRALTRVLADPNYEIEAYDNPEEALRRARSSVYDLVISDYRMPQMDGVTFLTDIRELQPEIMRLILSAYGDLESIMAAINQAEIYRFISKPWHDHELRITVSQALSQRKILVENRYLAEQMRHQQQQLDRQASALETLAQRHPEIVNVNWADDGSILLDETDLD